MKKLIAIIAIIALLAVMAIFPAMAISLTGYNRQIVDLNYNFKYAVLMRADGEQLIKIKSWRDYSDGDQIQITSVDGITYLTHSTNVILMSDI